MADLAELQQALACLLGVTQATVQLARRATALAVPDCDSDLAQVLQQLSRSGEQVQHRCQLLIARHAGLHPSRITATSRKIKAAIMGSCGEDAAMEDVLVLLAKVADQARVATADLKARNRPDCDQAVAEFADYAVSVQDFYPAAVVTARSYSGQLVQPDSSSLRSGSAGLDPPGGR